MNQGTTDIGAGIYAAFGIGLGLILFASAIGGRRRGA